MKSSKRLSLVLLTFAAPCAHPQQPSQKPPAFEVVSVKRDRSSVQPPSIQSPQNGDTVTITNMSARTILGFAFDLARHDDMEGLPAWADSEAYDITAKVAASDLAAFHELLPRGRNPMLRPLLAERFHLKFHYETRPLPAYALVVSKGGPKLTEVQPGTTADGHIDPGGVHRSPDGITSNAAAIAVLIDALSEQLGRPVVDRTNLNGRYNFTLHFAPVQAANDAQSDSAPSLFSAVQDQLGLKLESIKAPVQVLVVDQMERPTVD